MYFILINYKKSKMKNLIGIIILSFMMFGCSENYSNGERIGFITKFTKKGVVWKTWEGEMNVSQTGMTSNATEFDFSIDNDNEPPGVASLLDSAANLGWKVKLKYHETIGKNWFGNRGSTDHFVTEVQILDRHPMQSIFGDNQNKQQNQSQQQGKVIDTIYVVIDKTKN